MSKMNTNYMSRIDARKLFKTYGAKSIVYIVHEDKFGIPVQNIDIEYYFDENDVEIGYHCNPTETISKIKRSWSSHIRYKKYPL